GAERHGLAGVRPRCRQGRQRWLGRQRRLGRQRWPPRQRWLRRPWRLERRSRRDVLPRRWPAMTRRNVQAGLTLIEVMIASAVMVMMMTLAWRTISNTSDARRSAGTYQERHHELRMALGRMVADFEHAYLS